MQPYALVVGGGQGGIALGARLRQLGVPAIVVDKHERPGDQWRKRYKSLCLHDPVWYDHLPYLPFPHELAGVRAEGQDRRLAGVLHPGDGGAVLVEDDVPVGVVRRRTPRRWTVEVDRDGERLTLHPTQLVLATGMSGKPSVPTLPGQDVFRGDQHHSSAHPGPGPLRRQEGRGDRVQQLRARHLQGARTRTAST